MTSKSDEDVQIHIDKQGRVTATVDEVQRVDEAWALAIGRFIVAFANLEHWTYLFIRTFGSNTEAKDSNNQGLRRRIAVTQSVLARLRLTPDMQERVDTAIERFRKLKPTRNLLAHNPPAVHVYMENEDGSGAMEVRNELRDSRDPSVVVTIKQLELDFAEAQVVEDELALLYGLVRKPENRQR